MYHVFMWPEAEPQNIAWRKRIYARHVLLWHHMFLWPPGGTKHIIMSNNSRSSSSSSTGSGGGGGGGGISHRPSPRSPSLTVPSRHTSTLAGLRSRCMILSPCMWSSPSQICVKSLPMVSSLRRVPAFCVRSSMPGRGGGGGYAGGGCRGLSRACGELCSFNKKQ